MPPGQGPGQAVLDKTGNLKAVQKLLGHSSITTTGDIYTDWDIDQLEQTMRERQTGRSRGVKYSRRSGRACS